MEKAEDCLFRHHPTIWLETAETSRASGFYRKLGWLPVKRLGQGDVRFEKQRQSTASGHARARGMH